MDLADQKKRLRAVCRARRGALAGLPRCDAAAAIARGVLALPELAAPADVLAYAATPAEVPTREIVEALLGGGHRVALPRITDARAGAMEAVHVAGWEVLRPGPLGTLAPPAGPVMAQPAVVLVPGVGFCPDSGARLGQGGGFYDRYLAGHPGALAVGLAFAAQLDPAVASVAQGHDVRMDVLCAEDRVLRF